MIFYAVLIVLIITGIIVICNFFTAPVITLSSISKLEKEMVSVLIPARNEESNIEKCLNNITNQSYENIEIIVLDDESDDNTYLYASRASHRDKRIRVVKGKPLPENFIGKNWACYQLSLLASGSYLLFVDADVTLQKDSIAAAINETEIYNLHLLSVFPSQKLYSLGEWLTVPLMNWLLLTFLPLKLVYSSDSRSFAAANGQFMLFDHEIYDQIGGHKALSKIITEDIEFVRLLKAKKYRVRTYLGGKLVHCRMYNGFPDSFRGFSKNFYPGFSLNPLIFLVMTVFLFICFNAPLFLTFSNVIFFPLLIIIFLQRIIISLISRQNVLINVLLHPFQMLLLLLLGVNSLIESKRRKRIWKGRTF